MRVFFIILAAFSLGMCLPVPIPGPSLSTRSMSGAESSAGPPAREPKLHPRAGRRVVHFLRATGQAIGLGAPNIPQNYKQRGLSRAINDAFGSRADITFLGDFTPDQNNADILFLEFTGMGCEDPQSPPAGVYGWAARAVAPHVGDPPPGAPPRNLVWYVGISRGQPGVHPFAPMNAPIRTPEPEHRETETERSARQDAGRRLNRWNALNAIFVANFMPGVLRVAAPLPQPPAHIPGFHPPAGHNPVLNPSVPPFQPGQPAHAMHNPALNPFAPVFHPGLPPAPAPRPPHPLFRAPQRPPLRTIAPAPAPALQPLAPQPPARALQPLAPHPLAFPPAPPPAHHPLALAGRSRNVFFINDRLQQVGIPGTPGWQQLGPIAHQEAISIGISKAMGVEHVPTIFFGTWTQIILQEYSFLVMIIHGTGCEQGCYAWAAQAEKVERGNEKVDVGEGHAWYVGASRGHPSTHQFETMWDPPDKPAAEKVWRDTWSELRDIFLRGFMHVQPPPVSPPYVAILPAP